jgi:DNA invertase Pin-like site-specific DNA recombinase
LCQKPQIGFQSLQESIDTTSIGGKLVFHLFGALAEFERGLIRERTKAGLAAARARGRLGGRPKVLDKKQRRLVVRLYNERKSTTKEICEMMNISRPTLYSYLREEKAQS